MCVYIYVCKRKERERENVRSGSRRSAAGENSQLIYVPINC